MAQSITGVVNALFQVCADTVYVDRFDPTGAPVLVLMGDVGQDQPNHMVIVGTEIRTPIDRPTLGTGRSRQMDAEIDCVLSVFVAGGPEAQPAAIEQAFDLLDLLETCLRTSPNERLGGACWDSWVTTGRLTPTTAYQGLDDPTAPPVPVGRIAELLVTVTARIRY